MSHEFAHRHKLGIASAIGIMLVAAMVVSAEIGNAAVKARV